MEAKTEILDTIKHTELSEIEKFNQLLVFYKKHPKKNTALEVMLNKSGYSSSTYKKLIYELKMLYKISDVEIADHILPENKANCRECLPKESDHTLENKKERVPWGFCETPEEKCTDNYCDEQGCQNRVRHLVNEPKFRDEFSFLDDESTPDELKILASDRISTYRKLQEKRKELENENITDDQRAELAKEITSLDEKNSLLWDELKHYQENKEILGKHEIFLTHNLEKKVELMSAPEILQRSESLKNQIRTAKMMRGKAVKKKDEEKVNEFDKKIERLETELKLIVKSIEK